MDFTLTQRTVWTSGTFFKLQRINFYNCVALLPLLSLRFRCECGEGCKSQKEWPGAPRTGLWCTWSPICLACPWAIHSLPCPLCGAQRVQSLHTAPGLDMLPVVQPELLSLLQGYWERYALPIRLVRHSEVKKLFTWTCFGCHVRKANLRAKATHRTVLLVAWHSLESTVWVPGPSHAWSHPWFNSHEPKDSLLCKTPSSWAEDADSIVSPIAKMSW